MNLDLFDSRPRNDPARIAAIREWAAQVFRLPAEASVMVAELRCTEPGCPPLETVIAILDHPGKPRLHKIHRPVADVTFADVANLANAQDAGHAHQQHHEQE